MPKYHGHTPVMLTSMVWDPVPLELTLSLSRHAKNGVHCTLLLSKACLGTATSILAWALRQVVREVAELTLGSRLALVLARIYARTAFANLVQVAADRW